MDAGGLSGRTGDESTEKESTTVHRGAERSAGSQSLAEKNRRVCAHLLPFSPNFPTDPIPLFSPTVTVGRNVGCHLRIRDSSISGTHATITQHVGPRGNISYYIEDFSSNGTFVRGRLLGRNAAPWRLRDGDRISFKRSEASGLPSGTGVQPSVEVTQEGDQPQVSIHNVFSFLFVEATSTGGNAAVAGPSSVRHTPSMLAGAPADLLRSYEPIEVLGKGAFSTVYCVVDRRSQRRYALKVVSLLKAGRAGRPSGGGGSSAGGEAMSSTGIEREMDMLRRVRHSNIVQLQDRWVQERSVYLLMEYCAGGDLFGRLSSHGAMAEASARNVFRDIARAMTHLHSLDIVHRDLKPENVLFVRVGADACKLADFGLARLVPDKKAMTTLCGTPLYVAPEIVRAAEARAAAQARRVPGGGSSPDLGYSIAVDNWSLGTLLFTMLCGYPPFHADESESQAAKNTLFAAIQRGIGAVLAEEPQLSHGARELLAGLMHVSPADRMTGAAALRHPWVLGDDATTVDFLPSPRPTQDSLADLPCTLGASQFKSPSVFASATPVSGSHSTGGASPAWPSESPTADSGALDATPSPARSTTGSAIVLAPDSTVKPAAAGSKRPRSVDIFVPESPDGRDLNDLTDRADPRDDRPRSRLPPPPTATPMTPDHIGAAPRGSRAAAYAVKEKHQGLLDFA
mmetsp:Transcript_5984/g.19529  ORF Transcript_5984/g.19529 Transcript_5984/m.19529 type:complete len:684 (-) Transcript_5984:100-2151(-)